ncbi:UDP-2,3-diacylglucosamine diphosphatase [Aeoliella sp. SH292]|uniref:UDP-2,3-diacylglucosamine diphosphatase n=1 Tax=Aeoliella sp. SH292 TaxID=3454464 RepID=UPI003F97EB74
MNAIARHRLPDVHLSIRPKLALRKRQRDITPTESVRSLFVSDVHLGSKHTQAAAFLELIERYEPEHLYIVGDFIDGWKLKRRWRWKPVYDRILHRLLALKRRGTQLYYTPGNHDEFLRNYIADYGIVDMQDEFVHEAADGRRYLVMHGDKFDKVEQSMPWLSLVGAYAYDFLLSANYWLNWARGKQHNRYAFCGMIKRRVKALVRHISNFEAQLIDAAVAQNCFGIICGHIHTPRVMQLDNLAYLNTGDWVENCTALVEYHTGAFELNRADGRILGELPALSPGEQEPDDSLTAGILIA